MEKSGKRWTVHDRDGNPIYLTQEGWDHIVDESNHPEMLVYEEQLQLTLKKVADDKSRSTRVNIATSIHLMIYQTM